MKSKYDNIKTAEALVEEVAINGISTKEEDICRMQDIMGHSSMFDFRELLKVEGRTDTFYRVLTKIWSWKDVCEVWNALTNPDHVKMNKLDILVSEKEKEIKELSRQKAELKEALSHETDIWEEQLKRADEAEKALAERDQEILRLKAKLYDLMEAKVGA